MPRAAASGAPGRRWLGVQAGESVAAKAPRLQSGADFNLQQPPFASGPFWTFVDPEITSEPLYICAANWCSAMCETKAVEPFLAEQFSP